MYLSSILFDEFRCEDRLGGGFYPATARKDSLKLHLHTQRSEWWITHWSEAIRKSVATVETHHMRVPVSSTSSGAYITSFSSKDLARRILIHVQSEYECPLKLTRTHRFWWTESLKTWNNRSQSRLHTRLQLISVSICNYLCVYIYIHIYYVAAKEYRLSIYNNLNGGKTDTDLAHVSPRHISVISSPTTITPHDTRTSWTRSDVQKTFEIHSKTSLHHLQQVVFNQTIDLRQHLTNSKTMENHSSMSRLKTTVQRDLKKDLYSPWN